MDKKNQIVSLLSVENPDNIDFSAIKEAKKELNNLTSKATFNIEFAGAYMGQSSAKTKLASTKAGCWLNIRYSPDKFPVDLVLLGRYSWAPGMITKTKKDSSFFDYGINFSCQNKDFDLEVEYVKRIDFSEGSNFVAKV